jgi:hypothetical protein
MKQSNQSEAQVQPPILITTAAKPPKEIPFLRMTNVATRAVAAKAAIFFWMVQGAKQIVIADATGTTLLNPDDLSMVREMGVQVEQVSYLQDNALVTQRGKGYGEGQLIKYALDHSSILREQESFFKCTGKVFCRNFPTILEIVKRRNLSSIFWRFLDDRIDHPPHADGRFFYVSRRFAEAVLIPAYLNANDSENLPAEHFIFLALSNTLTSARAPRPLLSGFAGGSGQQYFDLSLGYFDLVLPCWLESKL